MKENMQMTNLGQKSLSVTLCKKGTIGKGGPMVEWGGGHKFREFWKKTGSPSVGGNPESFYSDRFLNAD